MGVGDPRAFISPGIKSTNDVKSEEAKMLIFKAGCQPQMELALGRNAKYCDGPSHPFLRYAHDVER